jgi:hypothetical protein
MTSLQQQAIAPPREERSAASIEIGNRGRDPRFAYCQAMISRRNLLSGLAAPTAAGCSAAPQAGGLMWGAYHFGTGQMSGAQQAAFFLSVSRPTDQGSSWSLWHRRLCAFFVEPAAALQVGVMAQ